MVKDCGAVMTSFFPLLRLSEVVESVCFSQASKERLETAMKALEAQNVYDPDFLIYKTALNMVRSASLNCYNFEVGRGWQMCSMMHFLIHVTSAEMIVSDCRRLRMTH